MKKYKIAFIVEGTKTEPQIIENLNKIIFDFLEIEVIPISYASNIYNLWNTLKDDEFHTNLIDVIKEKNKNNKFFQKKFNHITQEDYSEIYLFFDYDGHQKNLPLDVNGDQVLQEMLEKFNNETELGKLFVSYPMVEALRDYSDEYGICYNCSKEAYRDYGYKNETSKYINYQNALKYTFEDWDKFVFKYLEKAKCLLELNNIYEYVKMENNPSVIFEFQFKKFIVPYQKIMTLSGFSEFIVEYFGKKLFTEDEKLLSLKEYTKNKEI